MADGGEALVLDPAYEAAKPPPGGHGRREIRTLKIPTVSTGIEFPHAAQALRIRRRRHCLDQPKRLTTGTVYAITNLRVHEPRPAQLAAWIRRHWHIENTLHWVRDVIYDEDRSQIRMSTGPLVMAALRNAAIGALRVAERTNIAPTAITPETRTGDWNYSASSDDFAGALSQPLRREMNRASAGEADAGGPRQSRVRPNLLGTPGLSTASRPLPLGSRDQEHFLHLKQCDQAADGPVIGRVDREGAGGDG